MYSLSTADWLDKLEKRAIENRAKQTPSEKKMAAILTELKIEFVDQWIFGFYIADFYLPNRNAIIEVNGGYHNSPEQKEYDKKRAEYFRKGGVAVFVVRNEHVAGCGRRLLNFVEGKRKARLKKEKHFPKKKKPNSPLAKVLERQKAGRYKDLKAFDVAYKMAVKRMTKQQIGHTMANYKSGQPR